MCDVWILSLPRCSDVFAQTKPSTAKDVSHHADCHQHFAHSESWHRHGGKSTARKGDTQRSGSTGCNNWASKVLKSLSINGVTVVFVPIAVRKRYQLGQTHAVF